MRYQVPEDGVDLMREQITELEDMLDSAQERADEHERINEVVYRAFHDFCAERGEVVEANKLWWSEPTLQEIFQPKHFEDEPGKCVSEVSLVDGKKSYCKLRERWTNCREVGHCTLEVSDE